MLTPKDLELLVKTLQKLKERDLTSKILVPLFKAMGYQKVEFTCGADEDGKDLICWRTDEIGDHVATAVQVKRYKPSKIAADKRGFAELVTQLAQAAESSLPRLDMPPQLPSYVYFVTPFPVDTQALRKRFLAVEALRTRNLRIIDGIKLAHLVADKLPDYLRNVIGIDTELRDAIKRQLNNQILLDALHFPRRHEVEAFYTDLDFAMGHPTIRAFAASKFAPTRLQQQLNLSEWRSLKECALVAHEHLSISLLTEAVEVVEARYSKVRSAYDAWAKKTADISESNNAVTMQLRALLARLREHRVNSASADPFGWKTPIEVDEYFSNIAESSTLRSFEEDARNVLAYISIQKAKGKENTRLGQSMSTYLNELRGYCSAQDELARLTKAESETLIRATLANLRSYLKSKEAFGLLERMQQSRRESVSAFCDDIMRLAEVSMLSAPRQKALSNLLATFATAIGNKRRAADLASNIDMHRNAILDAMHAIVRLRYDQRSHDVWHLMPEREFDDAIGQVVRCSELTDSELHRVLHNLVDLNLAQASVRRSLSTLLRSIESAYIERRHCLEKRRQLGEAQEPSVLVELNADDLARTLEEQRTWLRRTVDKYNTTLPQVATLRRFLTRCHVLQTAVRQLFAVPSIVKALGCGSTGPTDDMASIRLRMSIHHVFDSGLNIIVLGVAGAGKTTTLQMYAAGQLADTANHDLVLYIPLSRVCRQDAEAGIGLHISVSFGQLLAGIVRYLESIGIDLNAQELLRACRTRRVVLLLDGIDEAIQHSPWLVREIRALTHECRNVQAICSSRIAEKNDEDTGGLAVVLMPFTKEQRDSFIRKWFGKDDRRLADTVVGHLERNAELAEIVTNPLHATVLAVLAENGLELPNSETTLYEERLQLLLGYYDSMKGVPRRVTTQQRLLEYLVRKLAFCLHSSGLRECRKSQLVTWAHKAGTMRIPRFSEKDATIAIDELIDPCNVLFRINSDGEIGFGHLRFQEHLAAVELRENRSVSIGPLVQKRWWRGVLVLYAQMADEIEHVIQEVCEYGWGDEAGETLGMMIARRPKEEREALGSLVRLQANSEDTERWLGTCEDDEE